MKRKKKLKNKKAEIEKKTEKEENGKEEKEERQEMNEIEKMNEEEKNHENDYFLHKMGKKIGSHCLVAVTLGAAGSMVFYKDLYVRERGVKVDTVVDTTCAGDTWTGYFLSHLFEHKEREKDKEIKEEENREEFTEQLIKEAMKVASKAASLTVQRKGSSVSIPYKRQVEKDD